MKRRYIVCIVAIVVGAVLMSLGVAHQGARAVTWNTDTHGFAVSEPVSRTVTPGKYTHIVVNTKLPVTIKPGKRSRVTVRQDASNRRSHPVTTQIKHGLLTIQGGDNRQRGLTIHGLGIEFGSQPYDRNGRITIEVPSRTSVQRLTLQRNWQVRLENLKLRTVDGTAKGSFQAKNVTLAQPLQLGNSDADFYLTNVTVPQVQLKTRYGDVVVKDSHFRRGNNLITAQDGDVYLTRTTVPAISLRTANGDVHARNNTIGQTLTATSANGDLFGIISDSAGVTTHGGNGDVELFGRSRKAATQLRPHAKVQYTFSTTNGDITVR